MSTNSGLAAVAAAANLSMSQADFDAALETARNEGLLAGRTEGHAAGRTEGLAVGRTEGAEAERQRLVGIDAHAIPGHEALIAQCKADPACTPDMAAGRILAAEKAIRENQMQGIAGVETLTGAVAAAPASQPGANAPGRVGEPVAGGNRTADEFKADFARSDTLRSEFASADAYANYGLGVQSGRIRTLKR